MQTTDNAWVYPRTRGEAFPLPALPCLYGGLSPHSRGSPPALRRRRPKDGSIPALAGKPRAWRLSARHLGVYPRTRGEAAYGGGCLMIEAGLSPHSRGSRLGFLRGRSCPGSIPALAGKPPAWGPPATSRRVYPRTRGEAGLHLSELGDHGGLSPHSRGSLRARHAPRIARGSIPALAGKPATSWCRRRWRWVYPRTRGEAASRSLSSRIGTGLSPHSRGSPARTPRTPSASGVYPRTRGEATQRKNQGNCTTGLSPHSRGSLLPESRRNLHHGSIPALAGKPAAADFGAPLGRVYPRTRGEACPGFATSHSTPGLSPHSRGSRAADGADGSLPGSIPALAGKP